MMNIIDIVEDKAELIADALKPIIDYLPDKFVVAGGAFRVGKPINDYDIYPAPADNDLGPYLPTEDELIQIDYKRDAFNALMILCSSANSTTFRHHAIDKTIQFCNYRKSSLQALVNSFDFNDIQAGCIMFCDRGQGIIEPQAFATSEAYERFAIHGQVEYTGTEYPFSSLIRLGKYNLPRRKNMVITVQILADMCKRGFHDYEDFKDQLDAIDLQMLPEHLAGVPDDNLIEIFARFKNNNTSMAERRRYMFNIREMVNRHEGIED
jgi:hypothetical protein